MRSKANPRWLWHAIDHHTGQVLAYVFGRRQDTVFLELKTLLAPFDITRYFTDGWGAYERHVEAEKHTVGKENTQKIESKHINLRTRIKRLVHRTICFSKTERMVLSQICFLGSFGVRKPLNFRYQIFGFSPKIEICDRTFCRLCRP